MDQYNFFLAEDGCFPSWTNALLPSWAPNPRVGDILAALASEGIEAWQADESDDAESRELWRIRWAKSDLVLSLAETEDMPFESLAEDLDPDKLEDLRKAHLWVRLETELEEPYLESFFEQLKLLRKLTPNAIALYDLPALKWHPLSWWESAIEGLVPPPPTSLFTIHAVASDPDDPAGAVAWLHTHGLWRCGSIELEMLDIPQDEISEMGAILNQAAKFFIEQGTPPPGEPFAIGRDIHLAWIPWEHGVKDILKGELGGPEDRETHDGARGILLVPGKRRLGIFGKRWKSPSTLLPKWRDNPILWVSSMESRRMAALATARFPLLRKLVHRFVDDPEWSIATKMGYSMDATKEDPEPVSEHLWFEVHAVDGARIDGTLLNQPYHIERMNEGDRDWHAADQLSDWRIECPHGVFHPDRVEQLLERLQAT